MTDYMRNFSASIEGRAMFDTPDKAEAILRFIAEYAPVKPDRCGVYEPFRTPFALTELEPAIRMLVNEEKQRLTPDRPSGDVFLVHKKKPRCTYYISWSRGPYTPFGSSSWHVEGSYIQDPRRLNAWLHFSFALLGRLDAWYARFHLNEERDHKNTVRWLAPPRPGFPNGVEVERGIGGALYEGGIPGVYWGNYFGPFYVEWFGREKFETLPCVHKQWLDTGGIFFTIAPTPCDWNTPEARATERQVREHLGADCFADIAIVQERMEVLKAVWGGFLPDRFRPADLMPPRRVPVVPFAEELQPKPKSREEEIAETRRYFEHYGFTFEGMQGDALVFRDAKGGITKVTPGPGGTVEHWPKL